MTKALGLVKKELMCVCMIADQDIELRLRDVAVELTKVINAPEEVSSTQEGISFIPRSFLRSSERSCSASNV